MKDLIFRGKSLDNGEWIVGGSILQLMNDGKPEAYIVGSGTLCVESHEEDTGNIVGIDACLFRKVDPKTVGQYIGLEDKNGAPIFNGDILSANLDEYNPEDETINFVKWSGFGWCSVQPGYDPDPISAFDMGIWTIVGNVHDNPELIERK